MRKVADKHPFCVLIYINTYIFHICFILFILLSYLKFDFVCLTLSSADTHGIAKYARTYVRDTHTHAHTHKKNKVDRSAKKKEKTQNKEGGSGKKEIRNKERTKRKGEKRRRNGRGKGGEEIQKKKQKKEGGEWVYGGRGAWVLRRAGPHTNNARSTWMFFSFSSSAKGHTTQTTPLLEVK